jgi:replicative DNA helicase
VSHGIPTTAECLAEEYVVAALLSAASYSPEAGHRLVDEVLATGLLPEYFWRPSVGLLFALVCRMRVLGVPGDPVSVAAELEQDGAAEHVLGCLFRLAHEVVAFTPAARWAAIVVAAAERRGNA